MTRTRQQLGHSSFARSRYSGPCDIASLLWRLALSSINSGDEFLGLGAFATSPCDGALVQSPLLRE